MLASALLLGAVPAFAENEVPEDDGIIIIDDTGGLAPAAAEAEITAVPEAAEAPPADAAAEEVVITEAPAPEPAAEYTAPKVLNITYYGINQDNFIKTT